TVLDCLIHCEPLRSRMFAAYNYVDVLAAAQTMVGYRQQTIGVRRQIDADDFGLLVDHMVDESRILMAESVVILPPDVRGEQYVQRRNRSSPRDVTSHFQPLGMLIEHRVDDVNESLVAVEQAMAAGQQIALQPAFALVFAEHLHHTTRGGEMVVP